MEEHLCELCKIADNTRRRPALDQTIQIGSNTPFVVHYRDRDHIYIWSPTSIALSIEDYGQGNIPAQQWINIAIKPGTSIFAPGFISPITTPLMIRWTDGEVA